MFDSVDRDESDDEDIFAAAMPQQQPNIEYFHYLAKPPAPKSTCRQKSILFAVALTLFISSLILAVKLAYESVTIDYLKHQALIVQLESANRQQFVKNMTQDYWTAYTKYAWGSDVLHLAAQNGSIPGARDYLEQIGSNGRTIVASMDTLWLMGLRDEYEQASLWVKVNFNFGNITKPVDVAQSVNELIGSLLSTFALTNDLVLLAKAREVAVALAPAYNTSTGLPYGSIIPSTGEVILSFPNGLFKPTNSSTTRSYPALLSEVAGQHLEYQYLSDLYQNPQFAERSNRIQDTIATHSIDGLYPHLYDVRDLIPDGPLAAAQTTLSDVGFYSYLIKSYIQSGRTDSKSLKLYIEAVKAVQKAGLFYISEKGNGLVYARDLIYSIGKSPKWSEHSNKMSSEVCYLGALFALASDAIRKSAKDDDEQLKKLASEQFELAINFTETCYQESIKTKTGLIPAEVHFGTGESVDNRDKQNHAFVSGLAESYFILYRLTKEPKYRTYAWRLAQSLQQYTRSRFGGFFQNVDVNLDHPKEYYMNEAVQPSDFISGTLKYLYLTFSNDHDLLPLDQWVFNSAGHPLPICGHNRAYPTCNN